MLRRAVVQSVQQRPLNAPRAIGTPRLQSRSYAKKVSPQRSAQYSSQNAKTAPSKPTKTQPRSAATTARNATKAASSAQEAEAQAIEEQVRTLNAQKKSEAAAPAAKASGSQTKARASSVGSKTKQTAAAAAAAASSSSAQPEPKTLRKDPEPLKPSQPLPDLTQGIPSTLDAELEAASSAKSDPRSLNITEDQSGSEGPGGGGELPKAAYISSLEKKRARLARFFYGFLLFNATAITVYYGRNWETEEEERKHPEAPSGWGFGLFYDRARARLRDTLDYYNEPAFPKLLPDTDPTWARPYTLILSLEDLLVHSEWSREHGWRMAKRPGVDYFLRYLSQYYEIVVWTSAPSMMAQPIINKLDPYRIAIMWPLFREATKYQKGEYIKDLSFLNRDPSKVVMLDTDPSHAKLQPENSIILPKWTGNTNDKDLVSLIPFLEYCAAMNFGDLRAVLKSFDGKNIPTEFARREALNRERYQKQLSEEKSKRPRKSMGFLASLTGGSKSQMVGPDGTELPTLSDTMEQGKTYQDLVRERGQKQYEMLEREIRQNGEKWLKEMADEEKKMNDEAMKGMRTSLTSYLPFANQGKDEERAHQESSK